MSWITGSGTWDAIIGDTEATEFVRTSSFGFWEGWRDAKQAVRREHQARAVWLVREHGDDDDSDWVAMCAISSGGG